MPTTRKGEKMAVKKANPKVVMLAAAQETATRQGVITMTMADILEMQPALAVLLPLRMQASASFRIMQLCNFLNPHLRAFQEARDKLIRELGEAYKDEKTGREEYRVTEENGVQYQEQVDALAAVTIDVPAFKIVLPPTLEVAPGVLLPLERFLGVPGE